MFKSVIYLHWVGLIGHGLGYACFRQVHKGLVVLGAAKHIKLPFGIVCHDMLDFLGQLVKLSDSSQAVLPDEVYFGGHIRVFS